MARLNHFLEIFKSSFVNSFLAVSIRTRHIPKDDQVLRNVCIGSICTLPLCILIVIWLLTESLIIIFIFHLMPFNVILESLLHSFAYWTFSLGLGLFKFLIPYFFPLSALLLIHKWCSWMISQWSMNLSYEVSLSWECLASFSIWYYHPKRKSCLFALLFPGGERGKFSELCKYYISWIHNTSMKKHHCFMCTPKRKKFKTRNLIQSII